MKILAPPSATNGLVRCESDRAFGVSVFRHDRPREHGELRRWLQGLFDISPDGISVSVGGWLVYANPRLDVLLGASALVGSPTLTLYPEEEWPRALLRMQKIAFSGMPSAPARCRLQGTRSEPLALEVAALLLVYNDDPLLIEIVRVPGDGAPLEETA